VLLAVVGCPFVVIAPGCGSSSPNESGGANEKVVIPANAPQTQEEYYKQSQEASKQQSKARKGARQ